MPLMLLVRRTQFSAEATFTYNRSSGRKGSQITHIIIQEVYGYVNIRCACCFRHSHMRGCPGGVS
jgi:hypothetical protein